MLILAALLFIGFVFLIFCLKTRKPERAVYGYLLIWILCPKWARLANIGDFPGSWGDDVFIFDIINGIAASVLFIVWAVRRPRATPRYASSVNYLIIGFLAMTGASLGSGIYFAHVWGWDLNVLQYYIRPSLTMVYSVIFGAAVVQYIDTIRKVETILFCFALSGIELTTEAICFYYFNVLPVVRPYAVHSSGRFQSLTYLSFDTVGLVSVVAICSTLYFSITRRSLSLLALAIAMFLPIIATSERAPLSAASLSLCAVVFFFFPIRYAKRCLVLGISVLTAISLYVGSQAGDFSSRLNSLLGGVAAPNNTLQVTFYARVGLWLRSLDIFFFNFPFGAGNGLVDNHMSAPLPAHFYGVLEGAAYDNYWVVVNNGHLTNTHNAFLEFIVENGVLGAGMLCTCTVFIMRRFNRFLYIRRLGYGATDRAYVAQACLYACILGMAWRYLFESSDKLYFLLFAMLVMISLLADLDFKSIAKRKRRITAMPNIMVAASG
jgi:hypothetical protein